MKVAARPTNEFRETPIPGLERLPRSWEVAPVKYVCSYNDEALSESTEPECEIKYVDIGGVSATKGVTEIETMLFGNAPSRARRVVKHGDIIVSTVRTYLQAIAWIEKPPSNLIVSTGFAVIRPSPERADPRYMGYSLRSRRFVDEVVARSVGISYPAINSTDLVRIPVPIPPVDEQRTIAAFLDHETARIDRLIEKQERLIELLKEKRQAVISHAVTKGLNPHAPMKDSGVEWLGEVSAHWDIVPSTWVFSESKARAKKDDEQLSATQKYGVILQREFEQLEDRKVTHAFLHLEKRKHVDADNFVVSMRSFQGGIEHVKTGGCVRSSYVVLVADEATNVDYFRHLFKSSLFIQGLQATSNYIRDGQDLNFGNFRQLRLPRPTCSEQREIAAFLDKQLRKIDLLTEKARQSIPLLEERRSALISAAVTGEIDVRNWKPADVVTKETATA